MSNGTFVTSGYTSNDDTVHAIRVQPETLTLTIGGQANEGAARPAEGYEQPRAKVSGGKSQFGLTARRVGIRFPLAPTGGYAPLSVVYVPWLNGDTFPDPAEGGAVTYAGNTCTFIGTSPERKR